MNDFGKSLEADLYFNEHNYRRDGKCHHSNAHYHRQMEIYYLLEGSVVIVVNSKAFHVEKGGVLVIPPLMNHSTIYSNALSSRMVVNCNTSYFPPELAAAVDEPFYVERKPELKEKIDSLFHTIQREYENSSDYGEIALVNSISMLTILLLRARTHACAPVVKEDLIEKAVSYIQKLYDGSISITEVAKYCGITPEHLSRTFKRKTNLHFNEYVQSCRLNHAEIELLENTSKTITEIAYSCGFNDSNYFSSVFKKTHGITPTEFRCRYLNGENVKKT